MSGQQRQSDWRVIQDIRAFAEDVSTRSRLPGLSGGPADALRHLIGAAELTRRLGARKAWIILESNEWQNWARGYKLGTSAQRRSDGALHRAMDRHNNRRGIEIGGSAFNAAEVVERAQREIVRSFDFGPGNDGAVNWLPIEHWGHSLNETSNWPPRAWPDWTSDPVAGPYFLRHGGGDPRAPGGPVEVRPHLRDGHPVRGHGRAAPAPAP